MKDTISTKEVATRLGMSEQGVRIMLQRGEFKFGYVVKSIQGDRYKYIIPRKKFEEFLGEKVCEE